MPSVACWCPAYALPDVERLERARQRAGQLAQALDATLIEAPSLSRLGPPSTWYPAEERQVEFEQLWCHDVLLAARGGYGCVHLLPALPSTGPAPYLIGFSDVTVLHAAWWRRGWGETLYGFMPATPGGERALATTIALARGEGLHLDATTDPGVVVAHPGTGEGPCFAGCLRVLTGLCGTPEQPDLHGAVLAIEDVDERAYQVDRDLQQLAASGVLRGIVGLVFGTFRADEPMGYQGPDLLALATSWGERLGVPTVVGLPFGHEADAVTLACGRRTQLTATQTGWQFAQASGAALGSARRS